MTFTPRYCELQGSPSLGEAGLAPVTKPCIVFGPSFFFPFVLVVPLSDGDPGVLSKNLGSFATRPGCPPPCSHFFFSFDDWDFFLNRHAMGGVVWEQMADPFALPVLWSEFFSRRDLGQLWPSDGPFFSSCGPPRF